jgi:hypothetical protein
MAENETVKKVAKPRAKKAAASESDSASVKKTATKKASPAKPRAAKKASPVATPSHAEIALLAYRFWTERGRQHGHAVQDWLRAEQELSKA